MNAPTVSPTTLLLLERQASQLAVMRRRLQDALAALGQVAPVVEAAPLSGLRQAAYARPSQRAPAHPGHAEHWPTLPPLLPTLEAKRGLHAQALGASGLPVVAVGLCGLARDEAAAVLAEVVAIQARERHFVPLFLTDRGADLDLFRRQGYSAELLPDDDALARCPGALDSDAARRARLASIARAWAVDRFIDRGRIPLPWPEPARAKTTAPLFFYKDYSRYNPYQHLLYVTLPGFAARPGTIADALAWIEAGGARPVFHLSWEEALYRAARSRKEAAAEVAVFIADLNRLQRVGGTVIWTLHNKAPHDNTFPEVHARLARRLAQLADLVHVHSHHMAEWAAATFGIAAQRIVMAPHGNYRDVLDRSLPSPARARQQLGLPRTGRLVGMIGTLRPYKGAANLLGAFSRLKAGTLRLLLAGQQMPPLPAAMLEAGAERGLIVHDRHLQHDEMASYAAACDAIVLPYHEIGTSGAALLAFSVGRPVIVPDLPVFQELVEDGRNGLLYKAGSEHALAAALRRLAALDDAALDDLSSAARATAERHDWAWIGRRLGGALRLAQAARQAPAPAARRPQPA